MRWFGFFLLVVCVVCVTTCFGCPSSQAPTSAPPSLPRHSAITVEEKGDDYGEGAEEAAPEAGAVSGYRFGGSGPQSSEVGVSAGAARASRSSPASSSFPAAAGESGPLAGLSELAFDPEPEPEPSPLSLVDQILQKLDLGNVAFNTPEVMEVGEAKKVELLLSPKESTEELAAALPEGPSDTAEGVRLAPEMEAALTGTGFEIQAVTPPKQAVSTLQRTRWAWTVTPVKTGTQSLYLSLSARIKVEGKDTPFVVQTFSREIEVKVDFLGSTWDFIKKNWQWLWTAILVPFAPWLWKRRKKIFKKP